MCREPDWLMQYNYLFCSVQSTESRLNFYGSKNSRSIIKCHETIEFHSKLHCFICQLPSRHMPFKIVAPEDQTCAISRRWQFYIMVEFRAYKAVKTSDTKTQLIKAGFFALQGLILDLLAGKLHTFQQLQLRSKKVQHDARPKDKAASLSFSEI